MSWNFSPHFLYARAVSACVFLMVIFCRVVYFFCGVCVCGVYICVCVCTVNQEDTVHAVVLPSPRDR